MYVHAHMHAGREGGREWEGETEREWDRERTGLPNHRTSESRGVGQRGQVHVHRACDLQYSILSWSLREGMGTQERKGRSLPTSKEGITKLSGLCSKAGPSRQEREEMIGLQWGFSISAPEGVLHWEMSQDF